MRYPENLKFMFIEFNGTLKMDTGGLPEDDLLE